MNAITGYGIDPTDFWVNVAMNEVPGVKGMAGYGEVTITGAQNNQDIWSGFGATAVQPEPVPGGFDLFVESDSVNDVDTTGTGIRTVLVHYIDTAGAEQSVTVALNGTTAVDASVADCQFVNSVHALTVGSGLVAAGNVDCTNGSGGAVVARILIATNFSLSTMRMVPAGKKLYIAGWYASAFSTANNNSSIRLRISAHLTDANVPTLQAGVYLFQDTIKTAREPIYVPFTPAIGVPAGATVKISTWTSGTSDNEAGWRGILVDD